MRDKAMTENSWAEITCEVPGELADELADFLLELTGNGVSIENRKVDTFNIKELAEEEIKSVKGYLPADDRLQEQLGRISAHLAGLGADLPRPSVTILQENDWANSWKENFKPTRIGERLIIKPSWESFVAGEGDIVLEIDPGMAFGTGTHATTRLCLEALERLIFREAALSEEGGVLDVGCGSGVLAIATALFGASRVVAIDIDPTAITVTDENAAANGVAAVVTAATTPLELIEERFSLVVANILAEDLVRMSSLLADRVRTGGFLVLSGILCEREPFVLTGFAPQPLQLHEVTRQEEWCCIIYRKEGA
jgi:ribosomal protein L11 methyltransferase